MPVAEGMMEIVLSTDGARRNVHLKGRFDYQCCLEFRNAMKPLLKDKAMDTLVIDLGQVSFLDSSALGLLLLLRQEAEMGSKSVVLANCGPDIEDILGAVHFRKLFRFE